MAPRSSTLAWKIPWMEKPGRLQFMGSLESDTTERLHFHFSLSCIGEGNGNRLQYSSLENPRDGEAQWAAVYGVAQSDTTEATQQQQQQQHLIELKSWRCVKGDQCKRNLCTEFQKRREVCRKIVLDICTGLSLSHCQGLCLTCIE